jgi:hypothetical protein
MDVYTETQDKILREGVSRQHREVEPIFRFNIEAFGNVCLTVYILVVSNMQSHCSVK